MFQLSQEIPAIYYRLKEKFGVDWNRGLIIANGDTIHYKFPNLPTWKIAHEKTHLDQQADFALGLEGWWDKYIDDPQFRLLQEIEAYRNEWKKVLEAVSSREMRYQLLHQMALALSGPMYGRLVTLSHAKELIKQI